MMKTTLLSIAAASLLSTAAFAQLGSTPVPPAPSPGQPAPPVPPMPTEPGEPPAPVPPEMPTDGMEPPAPPVAPMPPAPPEPPKIIVGEPIPPTNVPKASGPATPTGKAVSGWTTKEELGKAEPAKTDYPPCTRKRQDSCRNPGGR